MVCSRPVRSSPPVPLPEHGVGGHSFARCEWLWLAVTQVPLPKHGEVSLPKGGCVYDFVCAPAALLDTLAHEPLLVELWHTS